MSIERKSITITGRIMRPLAAFAITGAALMCPVQKGSDRNETDHSTALRHELVLKDDAFANIEFDILNTKAIAAPPIQGPIPPTYAQKIEDGVKTIQQKVEAQVQKQAEIKAKQSQIEHEVQIAQPTTTENVGSTGRNIQPVSPSSVSANSGQVRQMHISGYYCEFDSGYYGDGGGFCGAMSDGQIAHLGAAACGPSYPLGTKFEIDGYGLVVCEDRGSGIGDNDIDVFVPFSSELESVPQGYENVTQVG